MKRIIPFALGAVLAMGVTFPAQAQKTLRIAFIDPLTGSPGLAG